MPILAVRLAGGGRPQVDSPKVTKCRDGDPILCRNTVVWVVCCTNLASRQQRFKWRHRRRP